MAKAIHSMIRVLDLDRSIAFYRQALGLQVADRFDFDSFVLVYLRNEESDFELELTLNKDNTEPYDHGTAYGHFAVSADNVDVEHARLVAAGMSPDGVKTLYRDGEALLGRYFFLSDPDGYRIEVIERRGRFA